MKKIFLLLLTGLGFFTSQFLLAQTVTVTGRVSDAGTNESLPGVAIIIKGSTTGTVTNGSGDYTLKVAPRQILVFTSLGFKAHEVVIGSSTGINVKLELANIMLEEAVVIGEFGIKRPSRAVGAATQTVKGIEIAESGRENFVNSLQGRIAGIQIQTSKTYN